MHMGHGRFTANPPCPNEMTPRPEHSGQTFTVAPGAAPLPWQVPHSSVTSSSIGIFPPDAATRNGTSSVVSTDWALLLARSPAGAAEHGAEQVTEPAEATDVEVESGVRVHTGPGPGTGWRPATRATGAGRRTAAVTERAQPAHVVVLLPLLDVPDHLVRLGDLLEAVGGLGIVLVRVRMVSLRQSPIGLLDVVLARVRRDAEDTVIIPGLCHFGLTIHQPGHCFTTTRAGRKSWPRNT